MLPNVSDRTRSRPERVRQRRIRLFAAGLVVAVLAAACGSAPAASFSPTGPCLADGRVAGAYPDLEALVPRMLGGKAPSTLTSGRNCTSTNLGTLANHGLAEVHFAGGLWPDGAQSGITLSVWQAAGLQSDWMGEWYEASARAGRVTGNIKVVRTTVAGRPANRMDLVNGESAQTVITWPGTRADLVNVVIAGDEPESSIQEALAAYP